jgi:hypothetical protein
MNYTSAGEPSAAELATMLEREQDAHERTALQRDNWKEFAEELIKHRSEPEPYPGYIDERLKEVETLQ